VGKGVEQRLPPLLVIRSLAGDLRGSLEKQPVAMSAW
jgi:hypothetical protein